MPLLPETKNTPVARQLVHYITEESFMKRERTQNTGPTLPWLSNVRNKSRTDMGLGLLLCMPAQVLKIPREHETDWV